MIDGASVHLCLRAYSPFLSLFVLEDVHLCSAWSAAAAGPSYPLILGSNHDQCLILESSNIKTLSYVLLKTQRVTKKNGHEETQKP